MSDYFDSKYYGKLSYKATQRQKEYEQILQYELTKKERLPIKEDIEAIKRQVIEENTDLYRDMFLESLVTSANITGEYNRAIDGIKWFTANLEVIITGNITRLILAIISKGVYGVYEVMDEVAGSVSDFWEGVESARVELGVGGEKPEQAAKFWANIVWPTESMYKDTMELRFRVWGDMAPYWYFLEHGNFGSVGAFPHFSATGFLSTPAKQILLDINAKVTARRAIKEKATPEEKDIDKNYDKKILNLFDKAQAEFEAHPELYQPGHIFDRYISLENEREYRIYVTRTGQIGVVVKRIRR
jgi:hypothetical protein